MAFLSALAILLVVRAERRGWPVALGAATGALCGLDLLDPSERGRRVRLPSRWSRSPQAGGEPAASWRRRSPLLAIVAGPWLGYAAYTWGNPLQGNLQRPAGGMLVEGEPRSVLRLVPAGRPGRASVPAASREPVPPATPCGALERLVRRPPCRARPRRRRSGSPRSTQSVLGLAADALGLVGLVGFGAPAFLQDRAAADARAGRRASWASSLWSLSSASLRSWRR